MKIKILRKGVKSKGREEGKKRVGAARMAAVAFVGGGMMAEAIVKGFLSSGVRQRDQVHVFDPSDARRNVMSASYGVHCPKDVAECVRDKPVVVVAVKPQYVAAAMADARPHLSKDALIVSIAAGTSLSTLKKVCPEARGIVRVMPNTPCLIGEGASAFCLGSGATAEDAALVRTLMGSVGDIVEVKESQLDAVTGLSGSGPAYVYQFIEAMSDGGVAAGLPRDVATKLAAKTVCGAAKMVLETGKHPGELKDQVTSPAGTTIAGVRSLESNKLRSAVIEAVLAAANRADELARL